MTDMRTAFRLFLVLAALPTLTQAVDGKAASVTSGIVTSLFEADTRFVLQDGDARVLAECAPGRPPKVGSRIRVHGKPGANRWGERLLMVDSFDELAVGKAPPPVDATAETLTHPDMNLRTVRATGRVIDIFIDEIDARWVFIILRCDSGNIILAVPHTRFAPHLFQDLVDAVVEGTGTCLQCCPGQRVHLGAYVSVPSDADIRVLTPPPSDPFAARPLAGLGLQGHERIARSERRALTGTVRAVWQENRFLVRTDDGHDAVVYLSNGRPPPVRGDRIRAVGFPETDFFRIDLIGALWCTDPTPPPVTTPDTAIDIDVGQLFLDASGETAFKPEYHGKVLKVRGLVQGSPENGSVHLLRGKHELKLMAERGRTPFADVPNGATVEVTATCILDSEHWNNGAQFPRIRGYLFVVGDACDITVLSRPSWWTPLRLTLVIAALAVLLVVIAGWNYALRTIVRRKSHELLREQLAKVRSELRVSERTNLAVELHDALSQNLTGLAFQLASTRSALAANPDAVARHLETAERMLVSSRTELKRCLMDLRGNTLEEKDFNVAIRRTVATVIGTAKAQIRFFVSRQKMDDTTAHSILCIIRELAANAVLHGHAAELRIAGEAHDGRISFAVTDDGCGFDPDDCPGLAQGHFGLDGIRERVEKLNGEMKVSSAPGRGTRIEISGIQL